MKRGVLWAAIAILIVSLGVVVLFAYLNRDYSNQKDQDTNTTQSGGDNSSTQDGTSDYSTGEVDKEGNPVYKADENGVMPNPGPVKFSDQPSDTDIPASVINKADELHAQGTR